MVRLLFNDRFQFDFNDQDVWSLFHSYNFDFSVWEMYGALLKGGRLVIIPKMTARDPEQFLNVLIDQKITVLNQTPSAFYNLIDETLKINSKNLSIRYVIFGGEALKPGRLKSWHQEYPDIKLINMFGITETCVHVTYKEIGEPEIEGDISNIGKPIPTLSTYIMDQYQKLIPMGIPGELYVGGEGVARGYLNRPELTAEKFQFNRSYKSCKTYILYKSGDLAQMNLNGEMIYLGRIDHQVKIRGFRIELGEIEGRLLKHKDIKEAVVIERNMPDGGLYLCAYIVPFEPQPGVSTLDLESSSLREFLAQELPDYMIPSYFVQLEKIPLTSNGKIDRNRLPEPGLHCTNKSYASPENEMQKKLAGIWQEVLLGNEVHNKKTAISIDDNFFELGGHSLNATVIMAKIHKIFNVKVPLVEMFRHPTIRELAKIIEKSNKEKYAEIEAVEKKEYYLLSSSQKRLYFLQQLDLNSIGYNMPTILPLGKEIKKDKLEFALKQLIARHESLRTSIERINDQVIQRIHENVEFKIEYYNWSTDYTNYTDGRDDSPWSTWASEIIKNFIRPFDLSQAPLMRSGLIILPDGNYIWMVDIHHIVSDGTSQTILKEDFMHLYNNDMPLEPLPLQYKDFTQWQNELFASGVIGGQENYWLQLYAGEIPRLNLPADYKRPVVFTFKGSKYGFKLEEEEAGKFKALGARLGGTLYMNIMAVLNALFYKYTGQTDIIIGSGIAGRRHADIQAVVGMFVNTLAMRNYPSGEKSYENFLKEVIANSIKSFENQDVQFEELVEKLEPERDPSRNPLFDILMVVQNFREIDAKISWEQLVKLSPSRENSPVVQYKNPTSKFDLTFFVFEQGNDIFINIEYYTGIFALDTIQRLVSHFNRVVQIVNQEPTIKLQEISIISETEKQQVLYKFNDTAREYPQTKTIQQLFAEQVEQTPDHIALVALVALVGKNGEATYRQLDEQSNQVANYLYHGNHVTTDQPVGIMMDRSLEMIIAVLGILKAGGAYVPISPSYPSERIKKMINDAGLKILLSQKEYIKKLNRFQWECGANLETFLCIDSDDVYGQEEVEENQLMSRKLWEYVGETAVDEVTGGGWNSSYTGEPIPKEEMDEYGDNILKKLEPLFHPKMRVLEIGAASG
ncbi:MAG TPA: condensation domain-containing protein, partial [Candidatus Kapabacteria bacterium]|nr:condensation domain-containing protein [Candidatus Kapabacteria bacterium]